MAETRTTRLMVLLVSVLYLSIITKVKGTDDGVQIETLTKPDACEKVAKSGDTIAMRYKGNLYDVTTKQVGKQFDSNFDRPQTFDFKLGAGQVIPGWEKGVPGMCVGERRKLIIPPELAYGDGGFADLIPPKSTLVFEIELVNVKGGGGDLQIETLTKPEACEKVAKSGDTIAMRYKGNLYDVTTKQVGKQFDSNYERPQTYDFELGAGQVIQGWEKGVPGMCVGERRKLIIPPELAYGDGGFADLIPPKSTLVFEIELVNVKGDSGDVQIETLTKPGACEKVAKSGDTISMRYKGNLYDVTTKEVGKQFDSNFDRPQTFDFKLGAGQVIPGWEKGVPGMCVGERRKLIIPPELAYGDGGFADLIPPKSTLVFEIELVNVKAADGQDRKAVTHDQNAETFSTIDTNGDKQISREEMFGFIKNFNDEDQKVEDIDAIVNEIFQGDDQNKDGTISLHEYQAMKEADSPHYEDDDEDLQKDEL